jgi:small subunit ribosomal protein S6
MDSSWGSLSILTVANYKQTLSIFQDHLPNWYRLLNLSSNTSTIPNMNSYYLTLVLKADQDEKDRKALLDDVKKRINGKINKEDMWGSKDLAYPIKKQSKGFYVHFEFETDPQVAKGLDNILKVEEDILRHLLVRQ